MYVSSSSIISRLLHLKQGKSSSSVMSKCFSFKQDKSTAVIIFYCDGKVAEKRLSRYIFGSILRQLLSSPVSLETGKMKNIQRLYDEKLSTERLVGNLITYISETAYNHFLDVYIVVDGLDECAIPKEVCEHLMTLATGNVKVLAFSRSEDEIKKVFESCRQLQIKDEFVSVDVKIYVDWRLAHDEILRSIKPRLKQEISDKLLAKNEGRCESGFGDYNLIVVSAGYNVNWITSERLTEISDDGRP